MKDRGIDALINDCLIGPVLTMGSTFVAYTCALLSYLYLEFTKPGYNNGGTFTPVVMAFSFLIGLQVCQIFMTPIGSGVDTIFVAAAYVHFLICSFLFGTEMGYMRCLGSKRQEGLCLPGPVLEPQILIEQAMLTPNFP